MTGHTPPALADGALSLAAGERDRALAGLSEFDAIVLAASGGPDSMALLHLVAGWQSERRRDLPIVHVATVDHRLRVQSADEARVVAGAAEALGFTHTTLTWRDGGSAASGLQAAARNARYQLLTEYASSLGVARVALVTAHTADDQAETLLMRLARGSGLDGLAAMPAMRPLDGAATAVLVRPLLGFAKERLTATLRAAGRSWIEDPSNENVRFERVRLRAARPALAGLGFDNGRLALTAKRLSRARAALDAMARRAFDATVALNGGLYALVDRRALDREPEDIRLRVLTMVISVCGGEAPLPQLSQFEQLMDRLKGARSLGVTLGGTIVSAGPVAIRVCRELRRGGTFTPLVLPPGGRAVWDGRFEVSLDDGSEARALCAKAPVTVRPFGPGAGATLKNLGVERPGPLRACSSLPAFWSGEVLVAVPSLSDVAPALAGPQSGGHAACSARFLGLERMPPAGHKD